LNRRLGAGGRRDKRDEAGAAEVMARL